MFGIDGPEFVIILIVLIVVVGPKELPKLLRALGKVTSQLRKTANDFRRQFTDAMREVELEDVQKTVSDTVSQLAKVDPKKNIVKNFTSVYDPLREAAKEIKANLDVQDLLKGSPKIVPPPSIENLPADTPLDNAAKLATVSAELDGKTVDIIKDKRRKTTTVNSAKETPKKTVKSKTENKTATNSVQKK